MKYLWFSHQVIIAKTVTRYRLLGECIFFNVTWKKNVCQGCYGSRIDQPLIFRRYHWLGKTTITLIKNYQIKIVVLKPGKSQGE